MPDTAVADFKPLSRVEMAARVARDIPEGWYVNLGIGIPTAIADHVPLEREVIFHSENGVLGMGPAPPKDKIDPWLINAGKQYVTLRQGGSFCHHADSFSMIRGGHLDLCVLGAFQVAENGDIANWATVRERHRARGRRRDGPRRRRQAALGADGAHHQGRHVEAGAPLLVSADRGRRGEARLHQPGGARRDRARLRRARHGAGPDIRRVAGKHRRAAASQRLRRLTHAGGSDDGDHMMDPLEHLQMLKDSAAGIAPRKGDLKRIRALRFTEPGFDRNTWREMCDMGWLGLRIPEDDGGSGLGAREFCGLAEELGAGLVPEPLIAAAMAAQLLPADQLAPVLAGERIVLAAWQEKPNSIDLIGDTVLHGGRLSGRKVFIPMAAGADAFLVTVPGGLALVERDAPGRVAGNPADAGWRQLRHADPRQCASRGDRGRRDRGAGTHHHGELPPICSG